MIAMAEPTIYKVLERTAGKLGDRPALHQPVPSKERDKKESPSKYAITTWNQWREAAQEIACGLHESGIRKGDVVAIYSETRAEFYIVDLGILALGAISAALYTSLPFAELLKNVRASGTQWVFVENAKAMQGFERAAGSDGLAVRWILITGEAPGVLTLDGLRERGRQAIEREPSLFESLHAHVGPDDPAILYLTSGATGEPKMGIATQFAVTSNIEMGPKVLPLGPDDRTIVFLPSAHIAQRIVLQMVPIEMGIPVWFSESLARLPHELRDIKPTFFLAPPRVWERIYASVAAELRKRPLMARRLFYIGLGMGAKAARLRQAGKPVPGWMEASLKLFNRLVFSKIRERLGGALRCAFSGAAPLSRDLADFFASIGMPLVEGYGLTEGGIATINPVDRPKSGSIGKALPGVELKLAEDGELLIRSACVFTGYYKDADATASVLRDGWLYTGDIAEIDPEGYVYITGRKKELIVSSNGKKIYPARIEGMLKREPLINQVLLIGDRMPYVTALFTINTPNAEGLKGLESLEGKSPEEIAKSEPVLAEIQKAVAKTNKELASFEQIRKFRVLDRDFSIDRGELTPTMKVRRSRVLENYREVVSELYVGKEVD